jgi:hypothetical protein
VKVVPFAVQDCTAGGEKGGGQEGIEGLGTPFMVQVEVGSKTHEPSQS